MRTRALLVAPLLVVAALAGCGDDSSDRPAALNPTTPASPRPTPEVLTVGKSVVPLSAGTGYRSPEGFAPSVVVNVVGDGWVSTHRSADAFDVSQPLPDADAPLVVQAFLVQADGLTGEEAIAAIEDRAEAIGATAERSSDSTVTVTGGDGPLVASRDGAIALDAVPTGYARVTVDFTSPMLMVWWVPDSAFGDEAEAAAQTIGIVTHAAP